MGFDAGFFSHSLTGADVTPEQGVLVQYFGDVRDIQPAMLNGADAVVHLAGVSNDRIGVEFEDVTEEINRRASVRLTKIKFVDKCFRKSLFMRLNTLRKHMNEERIGKDLRWKNF